jgi:hypothetical protein
MFYFTKKDVDLLEFEQWVYEHDELEELLGKQYFQFIAINYKDKFAREEIEKIISKIINPSEFEEERIKLLLNKLIASDTETMEIMEKIYEEYCNGYSFLRYIALTYITTSDVYREEMKSNPEKIKLYRAEIIHEAKRILGFLERHEIKINHEHEYDDMRDDKDRIELHSIEKMFKNK